MFDSNLPQSFSHLQAAQLVRSRLTCLLKLRRITAHTQLKSYKSWN